MSLVYHTIQSHARHQANAPAILAPGREALDYAGLLGQIDGVIRVLNEAGVGRNDRVAIVLPNGPEMAVTFLGVIATATAAPLNPLYRADEFHFYLADLNVKALIVLEGDDSAAVMVARELGIPILRLMPCLDQAAGCIRLAAEGHGSSEARGIAQAEDVALVLHTSGTTARPKIVPLTQTNIAISAANIARALHLTPDDRCLNIMPLFHIHGLVGVLLSSMVAGASVVCTSGFLASQFFGWLGACSPTWYSAVPSMHQSILMRARENQDVIRQHPLRFMRSSSSAMPPQVMHELETIFGAPFIEAYGMTEASHQMATNPLGDGIRKAGSVGKAQGVEIAIADEAGKLLAPNTVGEIVIRGASVTAGYENNPEANQTSFFNGWFRTGDQGTLDDDGYLFISGRIKELINRGGEKISPREVDEVLLRFPDVVQAVTFAVPDEQLGEEVAAAVVLAEGTEVSERALRRFAAEHLVDFKVPRKIVFLTELPKGPTGKLQRIGLAAQLGITSVEDDSSQTTEWIAPRTDIEHQLADIWADVLAIDRGLIGVTDTFKSCGGDSMLAMLVVNRIGQQFALEISLLDFADAPTIADMGEVITERMAEADR